MHKKTKKEILDRCKDLSVLSRFGLKMTLDPWYVKLIRHIRVIDWISNCNQYYKFKKEKMSNSSTMILQKRLLVTFSLDTHEKCFGKSSYMVHMETLQWKN